MLILGHERSEEAGMKYMAKWLEPMLGGIPVKFIDAKEPFAYL
jgi:putative NIF3 family GTP cyclohydrolase 1 type 2